MNVACDDEWFLRPPDHTAKDASFINSIDVLPRVGAGSGVDLQVEDTLALLHGRNDFGEMYGTNENTGILDRDLVTFPGVGAFTI